MSTTENPFAFPSGSVKIAKYEKSAFENGMTLRDYFAAKAMQGFCVTSTKDNDIGSWNYDYLSELAYKCANAMLKAREVE